MKSKNPPTQIDVTIKRGSKDIFFKKLLPIIAQEDPYMIRLFG
jgi:hypothetical protein